MKIITLLLLCVCLFVSCDDGGDGDDGGGSVVLLPGAVTGTPSFVGSSSATLTGTVNPNGLTTTYYFQYGTLSNPEAREMVTRSVEAGSGNEEFPVSAEIFSLSPGINYYYYIVGMSSAGVSYGEVQFFTTDSSPKMGTEPFGAAVLQ